MEHDRQTAIRQHSHTMTIGARARQQAWRPAPPRRRRSWWRIPLWLIASFLLSTVVIFLVPAWRDEVLTDALLISGEIGAPSDVQSVTLCPSNRHGLSAWLARHVTLPPGRVISGTLASTAIHGARPYYIYLPPGYDLPIYRHVRYPVVYLLHGSPGSAHDWYLGGKINIVANRLIASCRMIPMILVMPDGNGGLNRDSQFINRWDGSENDETYIVRDVVDFVDRHFRTLPDPRYRALMGLSEGGYAAANLTIRNPDRFHIAVALSGYFKADPHEALFWDNPFGHDQAVLRANSPILRVAALPPAVRHRLYILLYDGADDSIYAPKARAFARQLARYGVPYIWNRHEMPAAVFPYHNWTYWRWAAQDALVRLSALFGRARDRATPA